MKSEAPGILKFLLKVTPVRIVVTACAVVAVLALSLLPAEHLHTSQSGAMLVHRHVVDVGAEHPDAGLDHGDHTSATTVDSTFSLQRQYSSVRTLIPAGLLAVAPDRRFSGRVDRIDAPRSHGPPIRVRSLRAPPA